MRDPCAAFNCPLIVRYTDVTVFGLEHSCRQSYDCVKQSMA
jgi:hypothetical protein